MIRTEIDLFLFGSNLVDQMFLFCARLSIVSEIAVAQLPAEQRRQPSSMRVPPSPVPSEPCLGGAGPPKPPRDPLRMSARDLGGRFADRGLFDSNPPKEQQQGQQCNSGSRRVKRRDSHLRRHTLQGGVDFSMVSKGMMGVSGRSVGRSRDTYGPTTSDLGRPSSNPLGHPICR